jgi:protein TonB
MPPPPKLLTHVKAEVVLPVKRRPHPPRPVQKPQSEETTAPQALVAPPKPVAASPVQGAASEASNAAQSWENGLLAQLERVKRYPGAAQAQGQEDLVYVRLTIDRAGRLADAQVVRSRGYAMLDREVVAMAHRASPFPAPPTEERDPVVVVVPVEFFIGSQSAAN